MGRRNPFVLIAVFATIIALLLMGTGSVPWTFALEAPPNYITQWGRKGMADGQFINPFDVAVDSSGNVYVVDAGNNRIQKFDSSGGFITKWGSGDEQFMQPLGVAVDSSSFVYVLYGDFYSDFILKKFDGNGVFITQWGRGGNGDGEFMFPLGVAVDSSGNVYVANNGNNRIQKFDSNGVFLSKWGSQGNGDGEFQHAHGVAVDNIDNVYVSDLQNHRIQKFGYAPTPTPTPMRYFLPSVINASTHTPTPTATPMTSGRVSILVIHFDGTGNSEPDEYVEFQNVDSFPIQIDGWTVRNDHGNVFAFPVFLLQPGQVCRVYTDEFHPDWCGFTYRSGSAIWNDGGDCAFLRNGLGTPIDTYCYP